MKGIIQAILVSSLLLASSAHAVKVKEGKDNMYWASYDSFSNSTVKYIVDTSSRLCYALHLSGASGFTLIPCEALAKREEWKEIISWVN